ncbi:pyruvate carboxylase [Caldinitratiruptor microaerophilus]|uniref:Pyruvate carboxylase n=1 Tax=Caldinitratiruptor microaerophilus TaxID=671077 RepID=A0AA35G6S7_9FIRM|nr:pyruvate carboxylase [Caldinitratiruptor microaerophilus]BDG61816.1 pyruvate carboxylase [Caldinitratiruptor microaerophilus]
MAHRREFRRVLVANRGEIATRIFQACTELGKQTVAIYSEADTLSLHRYKADEAYLVGEGQSPVAAYLDIDGILRLARQKQVDAIHPGYGFLAENPVFARRCEEAGIAFIGPEPRHLELFGDKVAARRLAREAGLPVVPGTDEPVASEAEALAFAREHGYPVIVKAVAGGGGRGMRVVRGEAELLLALESARSEARAAFGDGSVYLERLVQSPRHIEVQVLGDRSGRVIHLWERDCSVQRRHQKVVEVAPAVRLDPGLREAICQAAVALMTRAGYVNAGTVEFLVDREGRFYFIEVNPRIQVEHTITELILGVDIVQAQIRLAEGYLLSELGPILPDPERLVPRGYAIQCRVTTEDPENAFLPDTGRITAFRAPGGFGVRLDVGGGHAGAEITPHYDSLLVKLSTWALTFEQAARKMHRALQEFRVRGVKTNIPFLENVVTHPDFLAGRVDTGFIDSHPELLQFPPRRDRGTRLLRYIAHVVVNGSEGVRPGTRKPNLRPAPVPPPDPDWTPPPTAKAILDRDGPEALAGWVRAQKRLLLCDTTMRDAHQSLLATRVRSHDILRIAEATGRLAPDLFALECWGGATFDTAYRFLKEDPWERLAALRRRIPHVLFMMLLRGQSVVGYGSYPDNVVRAFVREAAAAGIDIFRIFDSLNYLPNMEVAIDAVRAASKVAEVALCYTGDILDPHRTRYDLRYYVRLAKEIERAGAHMLAIKDMAGLLKPQAAYRLVKALKEEVGLPVHLHTHDTAGAGVAAVLKAAEAGVDIADAALGAMAGGTSQPSLNAVVAALEGTDRATGIDLDRLQALSDYWEVVRTYYFPFEGGSNAPNASVYRHQVPGGQFTNLRQQAEALGLGDRWPEVVRAYAQVDELLGELIKVTPSSKMVGDFALFLVQQGLTPAELVRRAPELDFPQSVVDFFRGLLGQPPYGFPEELQRAVLRGEEPIRGRPGALLPPADFDAARAALAARTGRPPAEREVVSYLLFPQVVLDYLRHHEEYGDTSVLDTPTFLYGLRHGEQVAVEIEPGKTLIIKLTAVGEPMPDGTRIVYFELNGTPREVRIRDRQAASALPVRPRAERGNPRHVGASMPGKILKVLVEPGDEVRKGEQLVVIEAMKMETVITSPADGRVEAVLVHPGEAVEAGDLLIRLAGGAGT